MGMIERLRGLIARKPEKGVLGGVSRLVMSEVVLDMPLHVLEELRKVRASRPQDEIERVHDAFLLDPGFGPPTYVSAEGRILWDDEMGWGVEPQLGWAYAAILTGVKKTGVQGLLELLPKRPPSAPDCPECEGTGSFMKGQLKDVNGRPFSIFCAACWGLGWHAIPPAPPR